MYGRRVLLTSLGANDAVVATFWREQTCTACRPHALRVVFGWLCDLPFEKILKRVAENLPNLGNACYLTKQITITFRNETNQINLIFVQLTDFLFAGPSRQRYCP
jgi:hypothetical protein